MAHTLLPYEQNQDFNAITRFLHSFRHSLASDLVGEVAAQIPDRPVSVLELGCGTGKTFATINAGHAITYVGIDKDKNAIAAASARYGDLAHAKFISGSAADVSHYTKADIVFALETFEHIRERDVVRIVEHVCAEVRPKLFVVSVPVEIGPSVWIKNLGSRLMGYSRPEYTLKSSFWAGLYNLNRVPVHKNGHAGFNWYWLEQTIRHNAPIRETRSLPYRWLPKMMTPTVMFVAEPHQR
jgi:SAM-dependent methyltransferase